MTDPPPAPDDNTAPQGHAWDTRIEALLDRTRRQTRPDEAGPPPAWLRLAARLLGGLVHASIAGHTEQATATYGLARFTFRQRIFGRVALRLSLTARERRSTIVRIFPVRCRPGQGTGPLSMTISKSWARPIGSCGRSGSAATAPS